MNRNNQPRPRPLKRRSTFTALCAGASLAQLALGLQAADPELSVQERLAQLESSVAALQKENEQLRLQAGLPPKNEAATVRAGGKENKITIGGLIQAQAEFGDSPDSRFPANDRFLLRRTRINLQGGFSENFEFKIEGEFGNGSLTPSTGYRAQLTDAFIAWNRYDWAKLKIGQFKTPFGYEQLVSDPKLLTPERSLPNDRLTLGRQIGFGVSGDFLENRLGYSAGVFNGSGVNNGFNDNEDFTYVARVAGTPYKSEWNNRPVEVSVGANGYYTDDSSVSMGGFGFDTTPATAARDNVFQGSRHALGIDAQFTYSRLGLQAEYIRAEFQPLNNLPADDLNADGWYALAAYDIVQKKLQALVKFETLDPNVDAVGTTTDIWTFGLNYYIKGDDLKLQLNYLLGDSADNPEDDEGRLIARMQLVF